VHLSTQPDPINSTNTSTSTATAATSSTTSSSCTALRSITEPYPAVASYAFKSSPSICHPEELELDQTEPETEPDTEPNVVWSLLSLSEDRCRTVLCTALTRCVQQAQCRMPPRKSRGTGAELFALLSALAKGSSSSSSSSSSISKRSAMVSGFCLCTLILRYCSCYQCLYTITSVLTGMLRCTLYFEVCVS
jgi:hypothetical protein